MVRITRIRKSQAKNSDFEIIKLWHLYECGRIAYSTHTPEPNRFIDKIDKRNEQTESERARSKRMENGVIVDGTRARHSVRARAFAHARNHTQERNEMRKKIKGMYHNCRTLIATSRLSVQSAWCMASMCTLHGAPSLASLSAVCTVHIDLSHLVDGVMPLNILYWQRMEKKNKKEKCAFCNWSKREEKKHKHTDLYTVNREKRVKLRKKTGEARRKNKSKIGSMWETHQPMWNMITDCSPIIIVHFVYKSILYFGYFRRSTWRCTAFGTEPNRSIDYWSTFIFVLFCRLSQS